MTTNHEENGADRRRMDELDLLITTRVLDHLNPAEETLLAKALDKPGNEELRVAGERTGRLAAAVLQAVSSCDVPSPSTELRTAIEAELEGQIVVPAKPSPGSDLPETKRRNWFPAIIVASIAVVFVCLLAPPIETSWKKTEERRSKIVANSSTESANEQGDPMFGMESSPANQPASSATGGILQVNDEVHELSKPADLRFGTSSVPQRSQSLSVIPDPSATTHFSVTPQPAGSSGNRWESGAAGMPASGYVTRGGTTASDSGGMMGMGGMGGGGGGFGNSGMGMTGGAVPMGGMPGPGMAMPGMPGDAGLMPGMAAPGMGMPGGGPPSQDQVRNYYYESFAHDPHSVTFARESRESDEYRRQKLETLNERVAAGEAYEAIRENAFRIVRDQPLSTFSIDVDTASYANVRRFLSQGQRPPSDAVRIEELLNYFSYDYPQPNDADPFSVNMEVAECPWRPENLLLRVGLKGREVPRQKRAATNLVFLIDVSGSMQPENKLPLIKTALRLLVQELTEDDRVSIVTYAGDAGLKLPSTNGTEQSRILNVIESLSAGGSTHGSAGIELAYEQATAYFIPGGTNRVILLTDGDLNVGITDDDALVQLIQRKAKTGVFLTVLGVGDGNLKDSKMEKLADHGNGVYAYLDGVREARKVFVEQMSGSLITIAKDVKLQIEFNPAQVQAYRLVGYENRVLANRDFHDDSKDAGEIGAGHTVTALYELVPAGGSVTPQGEKLRYQPQPVEGKRAEAAPENTSRELLTLQLRFKRPEADRSELRDYPLVDRGGKFSKASTDFRFASAVAMFGLVLRGSPYRGSATLAATEEIASSSLGEDSRGYRSEFIDLVRKAEQLK